MTVTAVIPAYNAAKHIGRAIDSILAQTRPAEEIIVVDDGSTDDTGRVVEAYGEQVRYVYQQNGGASVARNTGIEAAHGEWIAFLDADDEWLPQKLAEQVELHRKHPDLAWSATNYEIHPIDGTPPRLTFAPETLGFLCSDTDRLENYFDALTAGFALSTITIMVKKSVLLDAGMFRVGQWWAQDTDLFFRIAYRWPQIGYLQTPLSVNHFGRPESITQANKYLTEQRCDLIVRHLHLAAEHNMSESFRPCAARLLTRWLRGYVAEPSVDIRPMLDRFSDLLPRNLRVEMRMRIAFPKFTDRLFMLYFGVKRFLLSKQG
ncbi:MAG: glycosyltransferase family 2 protein [Phycisphaerae bacterium]|nr:glycosyltransferase family 2 protein [Phycisphaerae bacterium]